MVSTLNDDVGIHITETKSRSAKRPSAKHNTKGNPPKKPRVTPSSSDRVAHNHENETDKAATAKHRAPDVSFRHLFSFANTSQPGSEQQHRPSSHGAMEPFSILQPDSERSQSETDRTAHESGLLGTDKDSGGMATINKDWMSDHGLRVEVTAKGPGSSRRKEPSYHQNPYSSLQDAAGPNRFSSQTNRGQPTKDYTMGTQHPSDPLMIPDDVESRPDQIMHIAKMFCRQQSVDHLEEDWCVPGGVRDTMKRDFKQKRQNFVRGRKLGTSGKR